MSLYEHLGYEVRLEPPEPEELRDECTGCLAATLLFRTVYTRIPQVRAAVFRAPHQPLTIEEWPTPVPAAGEILVRVAACGVCHTDLHYIDHGTPTFKAPPLVLGHEISGTVEQLGAGATGVKVGDRVLLAAVAHLRPLRRLPHAGGRTSASRA